MILVDHVKQVSLPKQFFVQFTIALSVHLFDANYYIILLLQLPHILLLLQLRQFIISCEVEVL